jgi:hypothetical protein
VARHDLIELYELRDAGGFLQRAPEAANRNAIPPPASTVRRRRHVVVSSAADSGPLMSRPPVTSATSAARPVRHFSAEARTSVRLCSALAEALLVVDVGRSRSAAR